MNYPFKDDFELTKDALGMSEEVLCQTLGFHRSYIMSVLAGQVAPSNKLLETFYSYAYRYGLRINRSREELLKEKYGAKVCFHGSRHGLTTISPSGSRLDCDFGPGFYMGKNYFQAASFIADSPHGSIYAFSLDQSGLKTLSLSADLDWMLAVCYFRGKLSRYESHPLLMTLRNKLNDADIIDAPIADNKMFQVMQQFGEGEITSAQALHALSVSNLGNQVILKTEKAVAALKIVAHLFLSAEEKRKLLDGGDERAKEIETKLHLAKREFRSSGKYIDEIFV